MGHSVDAFLPRCVPDYPCRSRGDHAYLAWRSAEVRVGNRKAMRVRQSATSTQSAEVPDITPATIMDRALFERRSPIQNTGLRSGISCRPNWREPHLALLMSAQIVEGWLSLQAAVLIHVQGQCNVTQLVFSYAIRG